MIMYTRLLSVFAGLALLSAAAVAETPADPSVGMITPPGGAGETQNVQVASALSPVRANTALTTNALLGFVNSEPVFVQDLFQGDLDKQLRNFASNAHSVSEFRQAARAAIQRQTQAYVQDMLVMTAAKEALTDDEKRGLDMYIATARSKLLSEHGGSQARADLDLKAVGSSVEKKMAEERRNMTVRLFLHRELYPKIVVTRQMVVDEYDRTKHQEDAEIELFTITLKVTRWLKQPDADGKLVVIQNPTQAQIQQAEQAAMKQANDIVAQIRNGADFSRLVEDNSQDDRANYGGRLGNVKRGSLNPVLEDAAFALGANSVGEPLLIHNDDFRKSAVVILKVGQKKEARVIPFSEAQKQIYSDLSKKQYDELSVQYMQKLAKGAAVEAVERMTDVATDIAVTRYATQ